MPASPEFQEPAPVEKKKRTPKGTRPPGVPRGPPRPHRKLTPDVLAGRIAKLDKRIKKARNQMQEAERHIEAYLKESKYRETDPMPTAPGALPEA
jgi:hypothetical protein